MGPVLNSNNIKILAVDDDPKFSAEIRDALKSDYEVSSVTDAQEAMRALTTALPELVLLDYGLPRITGLEFLKLLKRRFPELPVIMLTGEDKADTIIETMKAGATDYVIKGSEGFQSNLKHRINQVAERLAMLRRTKKLEADVANQSEKNKRLTQKLADQFKHIEIIGASRAVLQVKLDIQKLQRTKATVLITGENGTGKELVARNINTQERDNSRPFLAVNCAGVTPTLFESEFFGHIKGAFTGATDNKLGFFRAAEGGDIFLDEVGEIPIEMQAKLLRILQQRVVVPVGSTQEYPIDVRVIAATNRNLEEEVRNGRFREDLYYRINPITIHVPALRERKEDILILAEEFLKRHWPVAKFSDPVKKVLLNHSWPGNIRELENTIERACIFAKDSPRPVIKLEHLSLKPGVHLPKGAVVVPQNLLPEDADEVSTTQFQNCMNWMERTYIERSLKLMGDDNQAVYTKISMSKAHYFRRKKLVGLVVDDVAAPTNSRST